MQYELGDEAKELTSTSNGPEQIRVRLFCDFEQQSIGCDYSRRDNLVCAKPHAHGDYCVPAS